MKKIAIAMFLAVGCFTSSLACAEKITVAAAADLKFAMEEVAASFRSSHPNDVVDVILAPLARRIRKSSRGLPMICIFRRMNPFRRN